MAAESAGTGTANRRAETVEAISDLQYPGRSQDSGVTAAVSVVDCCTYTQSPHVAASRRLHPAAGPCDSAVADADCRSCDPTHCEDCSRHEGDGACRSRWLCNGIRLCARRLNWLLTPQQRPSLRVSLAEHRRLLHATRLSAEESLLLNCPTPSMR